MHYSAGMRTYMNVRNHYCPDNTLEPPAEVLNKQETEDGRHETRDKIGQDPRGVHLTSIVGYIHHVNADADARP